jgi:hypothetical protein
MVVLSDIGIVLSTKKYAEKYKIVDIFTLKYGRRSALFSCIPTAKFSTFSNVEVDYSSKNEISLGFWKLKNEKQNWIYLLNSMSHVLVCQGICFLLNKTLPPLVPYEKLFYFIKYLADNLRIFSELEVLFVYSYFEFVLLNNIGFGIDLNNITPNSYVYNLFDLQMFGGNVSFIEQIKQLDIKTSLEITGSILKRNVPYAENFFRASICELVKNSFAVQAPVLCQKVS